MNNWYDSFLNALYEKFPQKAELVKALMDLLVLEREAVYRRLSKKIVFPTFEIIKIASAWHISLDNIMESNVGNVLFQMHLMDYVNPTKADFDVLRKRILFIDLLRDTTSEYIEVSNILSRTFIAGFPTLYKFSIFKWAYEYYDFGDNLNTNMGDIAFSEELLDLVRIYYKGMRLVTDTTYILDSMVFNHLVDDIQYFYSIFLISDDDKKCCKEELHSLLYYLQNVADMGCFPETKKRVQLFISTLHISTSYSYCRYGNNAEVCRMHPFNMYDSVSTNPVVGRDFRAWTQKKKRTAVLISETDAKFRAEFFRQQHALVDTL